MAERHFRCEVRHVNDHCLDPVDSALYLVLRSVLLVNSAFSDHGYCTVFTRKNWLRSYVHQASNPLCPKDSFLGWDETESTWYFGHYLDYCTSP
jgi:hypothetical protein